MKDDLKNILTNLSKDIEQDKLLEYLNSHMSQEEKHAFEKELKSDQFSDEALEGLEQVKDKAALSDLVELMNSKLNKELKKKKKKKNLHLPSSIYIAILLILLIAIITYLVIMKIHN